MLKILLITMLIVAISVPLLAIKIIVKKNGRFPNIHVSGNKALRQRGIGCAQSQDRAARKMNAHAVSEKMIEEIEN